MRRALLAVAAAAILALAGGCFTAPVVPPVGAVFSNMGSPMSTQFNEQTAVAQKSGEASVTCILCLFSFGDASIQAAAEDGGLTTVQYADYKLFNILGIYVKFTTIAYGN